VGGLDARCADGSQGLLMSGGSGNGWAARGQGREATDVRAHGHSPGGGKI
jgi:hypothetical protein